MKNLEFTRYSNKYFIIASIFFLLGFSIAVFLITYFNEGFFIIIFLLSLLVILSFILMNKNRKSIIFEFKDTNMIIIEGENIQTIKMELINSYNSYWFVFKKIGYILRIKFSEGNKYYFLTSKTFLKWEDEDRYIIELNKHLKLNIKEKKIFWDVLIYFITYMFFPMVLLIIMFVFLYLNNL
ncbi:hypothetical protein ETU10_01145 [Apibacter muscae]|uniref:hypothetical protein n=1 Tax=Apibacter muscae TaxID=2509004 RepID=UPI0011AD7173|nr:hypothetical protein [Apibacter muscae]TWP25269.1 hypothetical protein ETU10_01145 [Apibacter muscae]